MKHWDSSDQDDLYYVPATQQKKLRIKRFPLVLLGLMLLYLLISFVRQEETRLFALTAQQGRVAWSRVLPLGYTSNVKVSDEGVFVWSRRDDKPETLFAFSHKGKKLWEYRGDFFDLYPEADDTVFLERGDLGIVFTIKEEKQLLGVDLSTGQERWRIPLEQNDNVQDDVLVTVSSPEEATFDVLSYLVNKHRLELHRYDVNGELQKTLTLSQGVPLGYTSLLLGGVSDDKNIYVALSNEEHPSIIKADLETGEILLELKDEFGELFLGSDALYVMRSETLLALNKETFEKLWQVSAGNRRFEKLWVDKNIYLLYTINEEGEEDNMLVLSLQGKELWSSSVTGGMFSSYKQIPAPIPGGVVTVDSYGTEAVFAFSEEGQELWRFPGEVLSGSASSDGEFVYVTTRDPRWRHWLAYVNPLRH